MAGFFSLLRRVYLTAYNYTLFAGWFLVLFTVLKTLKESGHENLYIAAEKPLFFSQTAAVLEILHGLVGESGAVSSNSNLAADRFKVVRGLGHFMEFPRGDLLEPTNFTKTADMTAGRRLQAMMQRPQLIGSSDRFGRKWLRNAKLSQLSVKCWGNTRNVAGEGWVFIGWRRAAATS
ncbi:hypothetical protein V8G54_015506 [Vigna mungo]|uniref:very-long-chain (3R)-3-hydroxyacyl-CoA dehydratase n=1 Tax=Vigna mungo TaxID=3915 RepID=A0AAQ3NJF8_VIGMU